MKNPFKFLPKLKIRHTNKSMFDAVSVKKSRMLEFTKNYYLYLEKLVLSNKLTGIHEISESVIMEFLMDQDYNSVNEIIIIPTQFREMLGSGAFDIEACAEVLGKERTSVLACSAIKHIAVLAEQSNHPDSEEIRELLDLSLDMEYMYSLSEDERNDILQRLRELKESVMQMIKNELKKR